MNLKRCENNHYYDASKFERCPHCQSNGGTGFSVDFQQEMNPYYLNEERPTEAQRSHDNTGVTIPDSGIIMDGSKGGSLADAVSQTVPYAGEDDDPKTVGVYTKAMGIEPVVGWLVCIEGSYFGKSFQLKASKNFIGRGQKMDVVLADDSSVSRDKHAIVLYVPKQREFIAQAGESRELFYLNDEVVLNAAKMKQYDVLSIGNTKLMLFQCCGPDFSWDDYKKEEKEKKK